MKNYGRYFELLIKKTFSFINEEKKGYFFKFDLPLINISKNSKISRGIKGNLDYYGVIKGNFIAIEVKSISNRDYLSKQSFTKEQLIKIVDLINLQAQVYVFVYFVIMEKYIIIKGQKIIELFNKSSKIVINELLKHGHDSQIIYPGILDLSFIF